jgi:hypothetical protein
MDRVAFRVGLKPAPRKQRVTIPLDTGFIEYFKAKAGERGYQTLINDTLRQAKERETLADTLWRVIRENCTTTPAQATPKHPVERTDHSAGLVFMHDSVPVGLRRWPHGSMQRRRSAAAPR